MIAMFVFFAMSAATPQLGFDQAKALADKNEASLDRAMSSRLLGAQGKALEAAMTACARPDADVSKFTVVLSLNADGSTEASWLQGTTALAKCVQSELAGAGLAGRWPTPFYTSFELSFDKP
ncbi:hypothetical protein LQ772_02765 [Frateuria edaphi]|jgi:hypothetical protein|uniref:hypothetical protein n=1 Tax=Frateuria TaxID=70411 RepID=UPI001E2DA62F|nr:hypothetical protein [Frateuria edaphi]UGB46239.1 hypothetical protein LQ772_02765 [Frateuria edaphi]